jgi:hypothetical protein
MSGFTILASVFKALKFIWPFIAEMFFAGKNLKQILMENKLAIVLLVLLLFSIFLNYASFSKVYELAIARRENDPQKKILKDRVEKDKSVAEEPRPPSSAPSEGLDPHEAVRQRLEHIYKSN